MSKYTQEYTIWDGVTPKAITSSTDATPIVVTATAHGFVTGDLVMIYGHTTNIAANGIFKVVKVTNDTFQLKDRYTGASVAGSGAGAGASGVVVVAPKIIYCGDFKNIMLQAVSTGTSTFTVKIATSLGNMLADTTAGHGDTPNFGATQSDSNQYTFVQMVDLADASTINGGTGIALTGTDVNKTYEINANSVKYLCPIMTAWTQGAITMKAFLTNDL